jgi:acetyl-CoA carboxylase biotin carboxyl carrier protein
VEQTVRAEMVASVHSIVTEIGARVEMGDTLMILESMKMEIPVVVEVAGTVREISVQPGDVVREGDVLAVLD